MESANAPRAAAGWPTRPIPDNALAIVSAAAWSPTGILGALTRLQRYEAMTDIPYAEGARHKLDVYRPTIAAVAPVIVFFYGGSWQSGEKAMYRFLAATLAARGYAVVVPDYRLYPQSNFPDFLTDGAKAVRWTRENIATFRGDSERIFVMGHSAGAYIAAMLALDGKWLSGVALEPTRHIAGLIGVSGPYDFLPLSDPVLQIIFGGDNRPATQPISFVEGRKPPAMLLTGDADGKVDPGNSKRLADELRRSGNDATDIMYRNFGHLTILAAFAPGLAAFLSPLPDINAFVERVSPRSLRDTSMQAGRAVP
jgi:acetyl esterase/lipase